MTDSALKYLSDGGVLAVFALVIGGIGYIVWYIVKEAIIPERKRRMELETAAAELDLKIKQDESDKRQRHLDASLVFMEQMATAVKAMQQLGVDQAAITRLQNGKLDATSDRVHELAMTIKNDLAEPIKDLLERLSDEK